MDYVSDILCHFVGRSLQKDEDRFSLLIKIIKDGKLIANMQEPDRPEVVVSSRYTGNRDGEVFEKSDCVCFCDIPDEALDIHTEKYSKFGLGFSKHYLANKGAHPVMYIPMNCSIKEIADTILPKNPTEYFNVLSKEFPSIIYFLTLVNQELFSFSEVMKTLMTSGYAPYISNSINSSIIEAVISGKSHQMMYSHVMAFTGLLSYIKLFDETLSPDDLNNYYMEREWRILCSVDFDLDDIKKIYLPNDEYRKIIEKELPSYKGEFYIFN